MKYIAAYFLAQIGGGAAPTKEKVKQIVESAGITPDSDAIEELFAKLGQKNLDQVIAEGTAKLALVGGGGAAPAGGAASAAPAEAKKEEKKEEEEVVEMAGGFDDLFG